MPKQTARLELSLRGLEVLHKAVVRGFPPGPRTSPEYVMWLILVKAIEKKIKGFDGEGSTGTL